MNKFSSVIAFCATLVTLQRECFQAYHLELLQKSLQMLHCADERSNTRDVLDLVKLITDDVSTDAPQHTGNLILFNYY